MKTLNEKNKRILKIIEVAMLTIMATTMTVFADPTDVGQNFGQWGMEQIWWVALAVVAFMAVKYLIKKAWVPCGLFVVIGGLILTIIKNPEKLSMIGESFFNIFFK